MKTTILQKTGLFLKRNAPTILSVAACGGVILSNYFTGKAVLKADKILNEPHNENTKKQLIQTYIPPVLTAGATIGCIIGAHLMNKKIQAAVIAAYGVLDATFQAYRAKQDPEADLQIMTEVQTELAVQEAAEPDFLQAPGDDYILWKDNYRKRPFWARECDIRRGVAYANKKLLDPNFGDGGWFGMDEFYEFVKGEPEPQDGAWGWTTDYMWEEWDCCLLEVDWIEGGTYTNPESGAVHKVNYLRWWCEPMDGFREYESSWDRINPDGQIIVRTDEGFEVREKNRDFNENEQKTEDKKDES